MMPWFLKYAIIKSVTNFISFKFDYESQAESVQTDDVDDDGG